MDSIDKRSRKENSKSRTGTSLLDPRFETVTFDDFDSLARSYDALISEFYEYYRRRGEDEPNLFGFVSVRHRVQFTREISSVCTENLIGQKTTVIYAPILRGETKQQREERRLKLLVTFDPTHRASHILALSLLLSILRESGIRKLVRKAKLRRAERG